VTNNGDEALAALERETFDVVLMDVQMPEMGGFEATDQIRRGEQKTGTHQRIIAMTAHAMTGDRERCIAAGMDDYLSKPIDPRTLFALVEVGESGARTARVPAVPSQRIGQSFNRDMAADAGVRGLFMKLCPPGIAAARAAIDANDAPALEAAARALQDVAANIPAGAFSAAARVLERLGAESRLLPAEAAWRQLAVEAAAILDTFRRADEIPVEISA
jgi:CheY-like chemotaxis protein